MHLCKCYPNQNKNLNIYDNSIPRSLLPAPASIYLLSEVTIILKVSQFWMITEILFSSKMIWQEISEGGSSCPWRHPDFCHLTLAELSRSAWSLFHLGPAAYTGLSLFYAQVVLVSLWDYVQHTHCFFPPRIKMTAICFESCEVTGRVDEEGMLQK